MAQSTHVLVVEREDDVREVIYELLVDLRYRVSLAKDVDAMRAFVDTADPVDLIVLDASTSEAEEIALAVEAKSRGIRLVMISGRPELMKRFHDRADQLLHKPFSRQQLERAVEHALASEVRGQRTEDPI
jgi:DNA-binding NtrC family response regulator